MSEDILNQPKHLLENPDQYGSNEVVYDFKPGEEAVSAASVVEVEHQPQPINKRFTVRNFYKRAKQAAVLSIVGGGIAATATEYAPNPEVSSAGTDALIAANDFLRDNGEYGLMAIAGVTAVIGASMLKSVRAREMMASTRPVGAKNERQLLRKVLPPLIVTATAMGTGLGAEAGRGANEPVNAIVAAIGADKKDTYAVVAHDEVLPFNRSAISDSSVAAISSWSTSQGYDAVPFYMDLGSAKNPDNVSSPSSAGIIALPEAFLPKTSVESSNFPVITTKQFADIGDTVNVEGAEAQVALTTDTYPGLDRTSIFTSIEALQENVLADNEPTYGLMLSGASSEQEIEDFLRARGIDAAAIPVEEWQERYKEFWDRSVTPLSMEFLLLISAVGSVGAGYIRTNDILRRRRGLANMHILGVDKDFEARAEYMRTAIDTAKATALAAAPIVGFLAITNSAQYGVSLEASPSALGAGAILVGGSLLLSTVAAGRMIKKMDTANEVR